MTYTPIDSLRIQKTHEIDKLVLGFSIKTNSEIHLFTGGISPMVVILEGDMAGHGFETKSIRSGEFLTIGNLEFEVDRSSMEVAAYVERPIGALFLCADDSMGIVVESKDGIGFDEAIEVQFNDPEPEVAGEGATLYFTKWRAVRRFGDDVKVLFEMVSQRRGS